MLRKHTSGERYPDPAPRGASKCGHCAGLKSRWTWFDPKAPHQFRGVMWLFSREKRKPIQRYRVTLKDDAKVLGPYGSFLATGVEFQGAPYGTPRVWTLASNTNWIIGVATEDQLQTIRQV